VLTWVAVILGLNVSGRERQAQKREYSIVVGEREYTFREIENLAREFGIEEN
jgi:hypothetical protein